MKEKIAGLSVAVNFLLAFGKIIVGFFSSSASVLAEGVHSGMDVLSSSIGLIGIKIAKKPVDEKHPYGHYKFEVLSGMVITLILFLTGLWIIYGSYKSFLEQSKLAISYLTLGVMVFSALVNEVMARLKIYYGKKENSVSLVSDGVHSRVDVWISLAVFIGLILSNYWVYADSLLAFLVGIYIIKESFSLGKEATDSLLDASAGKEVEEQIKKIANDLGIKISELKTQRRGSVITANIEIEVPKNLSVEEATKISTGLKKKLAEAIENLEYIAIQIKSHDFSDMYFKPREIASRLSFGGGFGWQRKGRFKGEIKNASGKGPEGYCTCSKCGYKEKHKRGVPCSTIKCPNCGEFLTRE